MNKYLVGLLGSIGVTVTSAQAAVPAGVTTALTDAGTDAALIAGLALAIVIAIYGFKAMRKGL
jgi:hypothetical protein